MKKYTDDRKNRSVTVLGFSDGPTSVFLLKKRGKQRMRRRLKTLYFSLRKQWIARTLKADFHTPGQVIEYARNTCGFTLLGRESEEFRKEYRQIRLLLQSQEQPEPVSSDLYVLSLKQENIHIILSCEKVSGFLSASVRGCRKIPKKYRKILRAVYRYYGVTQQDIDHKTLRYQQLLAILS